MAEQSELQPSDAKALEPLLRVAESDREPRVRLAALRAAARFPLDHTLWVRVAHAVWQIAQRASGADPLRREALAFAASVPLRSLRDRLRAMSEDPHEPANEAIARALDEAAEPTSSPRPAAPAPEFDSPESAWAFVEQQLLEPNPAFDDEQIGWMIARTPASQFIPGLLGLDRPGRDTATRVRLMRLIGLAAGARAGRAVPPSGSAAAVERPTLIDDLPRAAARGRPFEGEPQLTTRSRGLRSMTTIGAPGPAAAGAAPPPSPAPARAEPSEAADAAETRTVNALLMHAGVPRPCFIAGVRNSVHCWIGPKQAGIAHADAPIPRIDLPPEGLELRVELCWTGRRDGQPDRHGSGPAASLRLPADRSAPSHACELAIDVPADIDTLEAHLMFTYRGKVFEAVRLSAEVRASDAVDQTVEPLRIEVEFGQREVIALVNRTPVDATLVFGPAHLRLFGGHGGQIYDLASFDPLMAFLNDELFLNDTELVRRRERLGVAEGEALLDDSDPLVLGFFRDLARHGAALYQTLRRQKFTDPGDRIQVINLDPERHVPLEFIYDRATPSRNARLCAGWQSALTGDGSRCPACDQAAAAAQAQGAASWSDTICPLGFWAVRKVIERFDTTRLADLSLPTGPRRALRPLDAALCASTHFVAEPARDALRAALTEHIAAPTVVDDWDQWEQAVHGSPPLLILIAHHDLDAGLDYLEIGDENLEEARRWRFRPQLNEALINPATIDPGPIVLLLGCETGRRIAETGYGGLAGQFKDFHASLVLGTMAKILGRHAAPLAAELVAELSSIDTPDADFGTLLRRIRRRLLAHGILMAFALVAIGDAEWRLPARATATPPIPPQG